MQFIFSGKLTKDSSVKEFFDKKIEYLQQLYPSLSDKDIIYIVLSTVSDEIAQVLSLRIDSGVKKFGSLVESETSSIKSLLLAESLQPPPDTNSDQSSVRLTRQNAITVNKEMVDESVQELVDMYFESASFEKFIQDKITTSVNKAIATAAPTKKTATATNPKDS